MHGAAEERFGFVTRAAVKKRYAQVLEDLTFGLNCGSAAVIGVGSPPAGRQAGARKGLANHALFPRYQRDICVTNRSDARFATCARSAITSGRQASHGGRSVYSSPVMDDFVTPFINMAWVNSYVIDAIDSFGIAGAGAYYRRNCIHHDRIRGAGGAVDRRHAGSCNLADDVDVVRFGDILRSGTGRAGTVWRGGKTVKAKLGRILRVLLSAGVRPAVRPVTADSIVAMKPGGRPRNE